MLLHLPGAAFNNAFRSEDGKNRSKKTLTVEKKRFLFNIHTVKLSFYRYFQFVSTVDLCPTSKTRLDIVSAIFIPFSG